ncbi:MAG: CBS domain-containing protein [candidate division Zixibacteria bacterium]|nr:CBS domain-containing protein [candidate division Zixibacteria bacterium]MDD5425890.1 CBS domain-containing protein [candidate division Zixibacteria bacterium]
MLVKDILKCKQKGLVTAIPNMTIRQAMELLIKNRISSLPVEDDDGKLIGIISDKDIFRKIFETRGDYRVFTVGQLMTTDLIVGLPDDELSYIAGLMTHNRIRHIPIVEKDRLIGIISVGDIVKTQMENMEVENRYLKQYLSGSYHP